MLRNKIGLLGLHHPQQHPTDLEAQHKTQEERICWLFVLLISVDVSSTITTVMGWQQGGAKRYLPGAFDSAGFADGILCSRSLLGAEPITFGNVEIGNILWRARQEENQNKQLV